VKKKEKEEEIEQKDIALPTESNENLSEAISVCQPIKADLSTKLLEKEASKARIQDLKRFHSKTL